MLLYGLVTRKFMQKYKMTHRKYHLFSMLLCLCGLFILAQLSFYVVHYKLSGLADALFDIFRTYQVPYAIALPAVMNFILIQLMAYLLILSWAWYSSVATGRLFKLSHRTIYYLGILNWLTSCVFILILNATYFPHSIFARPFLHAVYTHR